MIEEAHDQPHVGSFDPSSGIYPVAFCVLIFIVWLFSVAETLKRIQESISDSPSSVFESARCSVKSPWSRTDLSAKKLVGVFSNP